MSAPSRTLGIVCFCQRNYAILTRCLATCNVNQRGVRVLSSSCKDLQKVTENDDQRENNSRRRCFPVIIPPILALSLFGKKKEEDSEKPTPLEGDTTTKPEKKDREQEQLIFLLKYAKLEEKRQNQKKAEEYYHQSLSLLDTYRQLPEWDKARILEAKVWIYDAMANLALSQAQFRKAESCYKDVIKGLLEMDVPKDDDAIIEVSLKLAMIYAIDKRTEEAEAGYKYCIETQERKILAMDNKADDNSIALHGLCVDAFSRFLMVQRQYRLAIEQLEKALRIAKKVFGESHPQVAVLHNDIATVASLDENVKLAKDNLEKAIKIGTDVDSHDLPAFYSNMAALCIRSSDFNQAKLNCGKLLKSLKYQKIAGADKQAEKCFEGVKKAQEAQKK